MPHTPAHLVGKAERESVRSSPLLSPPPSMLPMYSSVGKRGMPLKLREESPPPGLLMRERSRGVGEVVSGGSCIKNSGEVKRSQVRRRGMLPGPPVPPVFPSELPPLSEAPSGVGAGAGGTAPPNESPGESDCCCCCGGGSGGTVSANSSSDVVRPVSQL
jgi:hypothetical protein